MPISPRPVHPPPTPHSTNSPLGHTSQPVWVPLPKRRQVHDSTGSPGHRLMPIVERGPDAAYAPFVPQPRNQEVESEDESAGRWFDDLNKNVSGDVRGGLRYDDEPPFFIGTQAPIPYDPSSTAGIAQFGTVLRDESENEDLRDVIDDLTVENKWLKQVLRSQKQRRMDCNVKDKVFEVRFHGMRPDKKRKLEILLKDFAVSLQKPEWPESISPNIRGSGKQRSDSALPRVGVANLEHDHTDSGYGSNSGQFSATPPHLGRSAMPTVKLRKEGHIESYLHDIPDVLLPRKPHQMSERSKMALVVRRLEQLFTGRKATPGEHSQPLQQQEVSNSAARAEQTEDAVNSREGRAEGSREAHILPANSPVNFEEHGANTRGKNPGAQNTSDLFDISLPDGVGFGNGLSISLDQRPTRPLDLDLQRAQIAADNVAYIRHLGLPSPQLVPDGEERWIYLNLLVNLAQLHTSNVTPDFVRRSIKKFSTKFELSADGRQVRWRGGSDGTIFSKEIEQSIENSGSVIPGATDDPPQGSKISMTQAASSPVTSITPSEPTSGQKSTNAQKSTLSRAATSGSWNVSSEQTKAKPTLDYKPIFPNTKLPHHSGHSYLEDSTSSLDGESGTDATDFCNALTQSKLAQLPTDEGLLTFFNHPYFYSDFSADDPGLNQKGHTSDLTGEILGMPTEKYYEESALRHHDACYFAPQFAAKLSEPKNQQPFAFSPPPIVRAGAEESQPMAMEACGIGGTAPADNFAIDVEIGLEPTSLGVEVPRRKSRLGDRHTSPRFSYRQLNSRHIELHPSRLPPPSFANFPSSSSSDNHDAMDWSDGSETSSSLGDGYPAPLALLRPFSMEGESEADDTSTSIDMLDAARKADPEGVAAQERDYLLHHPLPAITVAGSLAVTVGESGQSTPAADIRSDVDEAGSDESDSESEGVSESESESDDL